MLIFTYEREKIMIKKDAIAAYQLKHEHENLKKRMMTFKKRVIEVCNTFDESLPEYTGWFVLLRKHEQGWEFLGFYNPDAAEDGTEPEWDLALPIPEPETIEEFSGW